MTDASNHDRSPRRRGGYTIIELMVVLTLMGVLIAMAAPSFRRTVERANADIAIANLRGIWAAQRVYWIANRSYASNLQTLVDMDLVNPEVLAGPTGAFPYSYAINSADATTFTVTATRNQPSAYTGTFTIDQSGAVGSTVVNSDDATEPPITIPRSQ